MEIETLLAYGATRRGCGQLRLHLGVTTVQMLGEFVRAFRVAQANYPRGGYQFHTYLGCPYIGSDAGEKLLGAYDQWQQSVLLRRQLQDDPPSVMV